MRQEEGITFWNKKAAIYDEHKNNDTYKELVRRIAGQVGIADHVLDMATGTGNIALAIAEKAGTVEAIDYSPKMIATAQEKAAKKRITNINFAVQGADQVVFPDSVFDKVVICYGLHVIEAPAKSLAEAGRVLKPDGILIAPTPCFGETPEASARAQEMMEERGYPLRTLFTAEGFRELVQSCGFTMLEHDSIPTRVPLEYILARPANGK